MQIPEKDLYHAHQMKWEPLCAVILNEKGTLHVLFEKHREKSDTNAKLEQYIPQAYTTFRYPVLKSL